LRALLGASPDLEVVGEAADGIEAIALVAELRPDVVVMDLSLPGMHGTEIIKRIRSSSDAKIVVLSMHSSPAVVERAREAGCHGYVVKGADVSELARAIRDALAGQPYYSPELVDAATVATPIDRLSGREREILQLIAEGNTNKSIAHRLGISVHTVNAHRVSLMSKLDLHDAQGLTRFAIRHGLIDTTQ
jgi:DNA-binding NarL/FixJ family response regulator